MTICRTFCPVLVKTATDTYKDFPEDLDIGEWLGDKSNVALADEEGDVSLFERQPHQPQTVCGHYFFHSRGRKAIDSAEAFLEEIFTGPYDVQVIFGLTPLEHRAALWMNKRLGFTTYGTIDEDNIDPCELVILTKQEWLQLQQKATKNG